MNANVRYGMYTTTIVLHVKSPEDINAVTENWGNIGAPGLIGCLEGFGRIVDDWRIHSI